MNKATCRTCGASGPPWHHLPSVLDPEGVGDSGHRMPANPPQPPAPDAAASGDPYQQIIDIFDSVNMRAKQREDILAWHHAQVAAAVQAERRKLLLKLRDEVEYITDDCDKGHLFMIDTTGFVPMPVINALLDSEQQKLGGK